MKTIENILMHNNLTKNMIAMKKIKTIMWLTLTFSALILVSCSKANDDATTDTDNQHVIISDDGKASNGSIFSNIDDKNFYLDYIKYTVKEGHLIVSGYDKSGFKGTANIVSSIKYKGNFYEVLEIGSRAFFSNKELTYVSLPKCIKNIDFFAFHGCSGLTSITIPNQVSTIVAGAFFGCKGIIEIHCLGTTPPNVNSDVFDTETYEKATLYVPRGFSKAYKSQTEWMKFKNIVEE